MVDISTSGLEGVGSTIIEKIFSGIIWLTVGVLFAGIVVGLIYYFIIYKKKFNIDVKITSERAGDRDRVMFDKAAILTDRKDKSKFFRIWSAKIDLPAPKFNVLQDTNRGDYLELFRTSENTIYYLTPSIIDKTRIIKDDGKVHLIAAQKNMQMTTDMDFWAARRSQENKKMFDTESIFMKLLPYLPAIMGGFITIFVLYILLDHLPGILNTLSELVRELKSLKGAEITTSLLLLGGFKKW